MAQRFLLGYLASDGSGCWRVYREGLLGQEFSAPKRDMFFQRFVDKKMIIIFEWNTRQTVLLRYPPNSKNAVTSLCRQPYAPPKPKWLTSIRDPRLHISPYNSSAQTALMNIYTSDPDQQKELYLHILNYCKTADDLVLNDLASTRPPAINYYRFCYHDRVMRKPGICEALPSILTPLRISSRYKKLRSYNIVDPTGVIYSSNNLDKFCRQYKLTRSLIQLVLEGKRPHHKGWRALSENQTCTLSSFLEPIDTHPQ